MSPALKRKRVANRSETDTRDEADPIFDESFDLTVRGEKQYLTYKVSIDGTAKVDHSAIQVALHEAVSKCTSIDSLDIPSSDKIDDVQSLRLPETPRTATGIALPVEIMNTILGHLKSDGQIQSLTAFQACSRYTYQLARPIIYSEMIVSLYGLRKIRMFMHLPTADLAHRWQRAYGDKKEERMILDEFPLVSNDDRDLARRAIWDLEEGQGNLWFALDGARRLRYNLREVEKMRIVEVCQSRLSTFQSSWGQPEQLEREYDALHACMTQDWLPPYTKPPPKETLERPFHRMRELHIEAESLCQAHPTEDTYFQEVRRRHCRDTYREDTATFEAMAILPLRSLASEVRLSVLCAKLPAMITEGDDEGWHDYSHPKLWTYLQQLGDECDRFEVRNISMCCYPGFSIPRAAKHLVFDVDTLGLDKMLLVNACDNMYSQVLTHIIEGEPEDMKLPTTMLWRVSDSSLSSDPTIFNLQEYHDQHLDDEADPLDLVAGTMENFDLSLDQTIASEVRMDELRDNGDFDDDDDIPSDWGEAERAEEREYITFRALRGRLLWPGASPADLASALRSRINFDLCGIGGMGGSYHNNEPGRNDDSDESD
jgi:hypothetical protein